MQKILIATYNKGKYTEFKAFFESHGIETVASYELNVPDVAEGDTSFADNAYLKAANGFAVTGLPCLGDDSGIELSKLNNFPGVIAARFMQQQGSYEAAVQALCDRAGEDATPARYVAELCLVIDAHTKLTSRATVEGTLTRIGKGERDFGYDKWLIPNGYTQSCAEMSLQEKERISHRGKALRQLMERINKNELRAVS